VAEVNIIVQPNVGWAEKQCEGCGKQTAAYVAIHLRHSGKEIILCDTCDTAQTSKPRMLRTTTSRA
jgi:hypothetical protein